MKTIDFKLKNKEDFSNKKRSESRCELFSHIVFYLACLVCIIVCIVFSFITNSYFYLLFLVIPVVSIVLSLLNDIKISQYIDCRFLDNEKELTLVRKGEKINVNHNEIKIDDIMILSNDDIVPAGLIILEGNVLVDDSKYSDDQLYKHKGKDEFLDFGTRIIDGEVKCRVVKLLDKYQPPFKFKSVGFNKLINIAFISLFLLFFIAASVAFIYENNVVHNDSFNTSFLFTTAALGLFVPYDFLLFSTLKKIYVQNKLLKKNISIHKSGNLVNFKDVDVVCFDKIGVLNDGKYDITEIIPTGKENATFIKSTIFRLLSSTGSNDSISLSLSNSVSSLNDEKATSFAPINAKNPYMYGVFSDGTYALGDPNYIPLTSKSTLLRKLNDYTSKGYVVWVLAKAPKGSTSKTFDCIGVIVMEDHVKDDFVDFINALKRENKSFVLISSQNSLYLKEALVKLGIQEGENYISLKGIGDEEVKEFADKYHVFGDATSYQKELIVKSLEAKGEKVLYLASSLNSAFAVNEAHSSVALINSPDLVKNGVDVSLDTQKLDSIIDVIEESKETSNYFSKLFSMLFGESMFLLLAIFTFLFLKLSFVDLNIDINVIFYSLYIIKVITLYPPLFTYLYIQDYKDKKNISYSITCSILSSISLFIAFIAPYIFYLFGKANYVYTGIELISVAHSISLVSVLLTGFIINVKYFVPIRGFYRPLLAIFASIPLAGLYVLFGFLINMSDTTFCGTVPNFYTFSGYNYLFVGVVVITAITLFYVVSHIVEIILGEISEEDGDKE